MNQPAEDVERHAARARPGPKSTLTLELRSRFLAYLADSGNITAAAAAVGRSRTVIRCSRRSNPDFAAEVEVTLAAAVQRLADELRAAAPRARADGSLLRMLRGLAFETGDYQWLRSPRMRAKFEALAAARRHPAIPTAAESVLRLRILQSEARRGAARRRREGQGAPAADRGATGLESSRRGQR